MYHFRLSSSSLFQRNMVTTGCEPRNAENVMKNGKVMLCRDCKSNKRFIYHRECPVQIKRNEYKGSMANGIRRQIKQGINPSQILACLVSSCEAQDNDDESNRATGSEDEPINETNFCELEDAYFEKVLEEQFLETGYVEVESEAETDYETKQVMLVSPGKKSKPLSATTKSIKR